MVKMAVLALAALIGMSDLVMASQLKKSGQTSGAQINNQKTTVPNKSNNSTSKPIRRTTQPVRLADVPL